MINLRNIEINTARWLDQNRRWLIKGILIFAVLVLGAEMIPGVILGNRYPSLFFMFYVLVAGLIILLRWPLLGLLAIPPAGAFIRFVGPSGLNAAMGIVAVMVGVWLLKMMVEEKSIRLIISRATMPILLLLLVSIISFFVGQLPWYVNAQHAPMTAQMGGLGIFVLSAGAFLLTAHLIKDVRELETLMWVFLGLGGGYVLGRAVGWGLIDRVYTLGFSAGSMFWTWLVALAFSQAVFNQRLKVFWRMAAGGLALLTFSVAYFQASDWKSGWLPPLAAIAAMIALRYRRLAVLMIPLAIDPILSMARSLIMTDQYSWGTRLDAWEIVIRIVQANPILGLGFANYYWITPLFRIRGYAVNFNSHNQYLDILAQTGLVGLVLFLWFFWEMAYLSNRMLRTMPEGFPRSYVFGAFGGLIGTLVASLLVDWVLPFVYNIGLTGFRASVLAWLFLGGLIALERLYKNRSVASQENV